MTLSSPWKIELGQSMAFHMANIKIVCAGGVGWGVDNKHDRQLL